MFKKSKIRCGGLIYLVSFVLVLGLALTSVAEAVDPSLVGWWKLDETSGTIAQDSSGLGNDGTCQGDVSWVAGMIDGAWQGDGDGDYVEVPHSASSLSILYLWVESLQLDSRIGGGELPINTFL